MAMKSLSELRALYKEPQLTNKWSIEIPTWPTAVQPSSSDVLFMITSSGVPEPEYENAMVELGGFKFTHNASTNRNGTLTWTFFENTNSDIIDYFFIKYANKRQSFESDSSITKVSSKSSELIAPIVVMSMYAQDAKTITKQIKLVNVLFQPTNFGAELAQEATVQKPTVAVLYDSFIWLKV